MLQPPPVHVDLSMNVRKRKDLNPANIRTVLDPYLLNAVPASLTATAAYLVCLSAVGWLLSRWFWQWISGIGRRKQKDHRD